MIQGRDFVFVGIQPWDIAIGSNCKNIASEVAKHNSVLYVNPPLDRFTAWRKRNTPFVQKRLDVLAGKKDAIETVSERLKVFTPRIVLESINQLPIPSLFDLFNTRNCRRFASEIQDALRYLGMTNPIVFNDSDMFRSFLLKDILQPEAYIYYSRDNLLAVKYWQRNGMRVEPMHIAKADVAVANSEYLASLERLYNKSAASIGQGCDLSAFNPEIQYSRPEDMPADGPVIGYIGALNSLRIDEAILRIIAKYNRNWKVVLVGPEDGHFMKSDLHSMPNVYFLGAKPESDLAQYLAYFDVAINPQKLNAVTIGNYPRKIDEYLAMGKETVATKTETMKMFQEHVLLADTASDYPKLIEKFLLAGSTKKQTDDRIAFARSHTWEQSVHALYQAIEVFIESKQAANKS